MVQVKYDVGYWNGGERKDADLRDTWVDLMAGRYSRGPLALLGTSEIADKVAVMEQLRNRGLGIVLGPDDVTNGRKEGMIYDLRQLKPLGSPRLIEVGEGFWGRRNGRKGRVWMARKFILEQEFRHLQSGWSPTHAVTHVWPSVNLQKSEVRDMVQELATWCRDTRGSRFLHADFNMEIDHDLMVSMRQLRRHGFVCSQTLRGPEATWYSRAIDMIFAMDDSHYRPIRQIVAKMPGKEKNGKPGHKAVILEGDMRERKNR